MLTEIPAIRNEEKDLPFEMNYIPEFFLRKCETELNETPQRKTQCIQELRQLLSDNTETKNINFHEDLLVQYLRHSKYNTHKAFNNLLNLNAIRKKEETMFQTIPDEYFSTKASTKFLTVLPKRSPAGCAIVLTQMGKWDPNELSLEDFKRIEMINILQLLRDPMTQINGLVLIHDFAGTRLEHIKYCSPRNLYLFYNAAVNCLPGRYKEIHILNETPVFKFLWSVLKVFLTKKIKERIFFHSHTEELLNHFPKSVLPVQYGGEILDMHSTNFLQRANKEHKENTVEGQPNFY